MPKKSFSVEWEKKIYSQGLQLNKYPYDLVVSIVARKFFSTPFNKRKNIKVLDLGCGAGNHAKFLAENGFSVYGLDGSRSAIKNCQIRFKEWGLTGQFTRGDFLNLPYSNNYFNLVLDRESLYANRKADIAQALNNVYKKLKPGGVLISFIFNTFHPHKEFGQQIEPNTYTNFTKGAFYKTGAAHFVDIKEVLGLYKKFKIENIIRHSLREVYDEPNSLMNIEEYIIIAKKV